MAVTSLANRHRLLIVSEGQKAAGLKINHLSIGALINDFIREPDSMLITNE